MHRRSHTDLVVEESGSSSGLRSCSDASACLVLWLPGARRRARPRHVLGHPHPVRRRQSSRQQPLPRRPSQLLYRWWGRGRPASNPFSGTGGVRPLSAAVRTKGRSPSRSSRRPGRRRTCVRTWGLAIRAPICDGAWSRLAGRGMWTIRTRDARRLRSMTRRMTMRTRVPRPRRPQPPVEARSLRDLRHRSAVPPSPRIREVCLWLTLTPSRSWSRSRCCRPRR
jgi:hypothetical protein